MNLRPALLVLALTVTACSAGAGPAPGATSSPSGSGVSPGSPSPTAPSTSSPTEPPTPEPSPSSPATSPDASGSAGDSADLVLRVDTGGGLAGPDRNALSIPQISVYGDGRVITEGAQIAIYPGAALPPLMLARLSPAGVARILDRASQAGLTAGDQHYPIRGIADVHTTTFTVKVAGETHVVTVDGLGLEENRADQFGATAAQARQAMLEFQGALTNLPPWMGTDLIAEGLPYEFDELRIIARPGLPPVEPDLAEPDMEWPLSESLASIGEPFPMGEDARCVAVSGDDLQTLLPMVMRASQLTLWASDGERYELLFRSLLPDESGCPET